MNRKQHQLVERLGSHMEESAGSRPAHGDRFAGFVPSSAAMGEMAIDRIMEDIGQPRKSFNEEALKELADNIKTHGLQQPIQLRWNAGHEKWMIVYGHRRFRATKLAGLKSIPCQFISDDTDESTIRVRQLIENCQREDLAPMEMARALADLASQTGWSNRRLATELGFNRTTLGRSLDLLKLPESLQAEVESGGLAPSVAIEVLKLKSTKDQRRVGKEIASGNLNRTEAKKRIDNALGPPKAKPEPVQLELFIKTEELTIYRNPGMSNKQLKAALLSAADSIA